MIPTNKVKIFIYYSYVHVKLGNLGGVLLPALCAGIIILYKTIRRKHYFIPILFPKIIINKITIIENTNNITIFLLFKPTLFSYCTSVDSFLFSKFFLMKVRQ